MKTNQKYLLIKRQIKLVLQNVQNFLLDKTEVQKDLFIRFDARSSANLNKVPVFIIKTLCKY